MCVSFRILFNPGQLSVRCEIGVGEEWVNIYTFIGLDQMADAAERVYKECL